METSIIGYVATSTSVIGFGSQAFHTMKSKSTAGLSLYRTIFDFVSLGLWVYYAARVEDNPLLIATTFEFLLSGVIMVFIFKLRHKEVAVKDYTPPPSPGSDPGSLIEIKIERRNSV